MNEVFWLSGRLNKDVPSVNFLVVHSPTRDLVVGQDVTVTRQNLFPLLSWKGKIKATYMDADLGEVGLLRLIAQPPQGGDDLLAAAASDTAAVVTLSACAIAIGTVTVATGVGIDLYDG